MISKLLKLRGIGLYHDALGSSLTNNKALSFGKCTILYAENGRGKSTLAAILRSLATGDASLIQERVTLDGTLAPLATFLIGTVSHTYANATWNNPYSEILVFDTHFVDTNVYSGASVSVAQRRNLLSPRFLLMLRDILRFNQQATAMAALSRARVTVLQSGELEVRLRTLEERTR